MSTQPRPDPTDRTWAVDRACSECGLVAARVDVQDVGATIRRNAQVWSVLLRGPVSGRPAPDVWSPVEHACHVLDVHRVFAGRVRLMLADDVPTLADRDQDAAALAAADHARQDPGAVALELTAAASTVAALYDTVTPEQLGRRGRRSNGSELTVASIARHHLHDVVHHLWDVRAAVTVAGYDALAADYRDASQPLTASVGAALATFAERLGVGARVVEIGSGGGRDARELETLGLVVRRTDVTPGFVALLREAGHEADVLDPLTDPIRETGTEPYDGVWANASLLHVARDDLPVVLRRLAAATRAGGVLRLSVKEGDGEGWSTHGSISSPRMFTYWREGPLVEALAAAGWSVEETGHDDGLRGERWLTVVAARP